jgi:uncharacterized membrane protein required for colicin V production
VGFLIDLLLLAGLGFCVWQGYRKGLLLTVAGVLIIFLSAMLAGAVASANAEAVSEKLHPILSFVADNAIDDAARGKGPLGSMNKAQIAEVARDTYDSMGITNREVDAMVDKVLRAWEGDDQSPLKSIQMTALHLAAYALIALFAFLLFMVGLTLLIHFVAAVVKLPVLNLIDKIGGSAAGFLYGLLILSAAGWAMRYLGIFSSSELVANTAVLRFFVNVNMLSGILSFKGI